MKAKTIPAAIAASTVLMAAAAPALGQSVYGELGLQQARDLACRFDVTYTYGLIGLVFPVLMLILVLRMRRERKRIARYFAVQFMLLVMTLVFFGTGVPESRCTSGMDRMTVQFKVLPKFTGFSGFFDIFD